MSSTPKILSDQVRIYEHWSPFADMRKASDAGLIAGMLIPDADGPPSPWYAYARAVLEAILEGCWRSHKLSVRDLLHYCLYAQPDELVELCHPMPGTVFFSDGNGRYLHEIRWILRTHLKHLKSPDYIRHRYDHF
jgi:hypothetical protein